MGLFYTPNPPHLGAQQPLEGKKLTPPSGAAPSNPPFMGGSAVHKAILGCWAAATIASAIMPVVAENLTPPSAPVVTTPIFQRNNTDIYRAWDLPVPAPIVAENLNPPISGPLFGVQFDAMSSAIISGSAATSFTDSTKMSVGTLFNRGMIVEACFSGAPTGVAITWGGTALIQLASITDGATNVTTQLYGLRNPASGSLALAGSWTGSASFIVSAVSFSNVDQSSDAVAFQNANTATGATSPAAVTVTSAIGDKVVANYSSTLSTFTPNFSRLFAGTVGSFAGAGNLADGAPSLPMAATQSSSHAWTAAGVSVHAASVPQGPPSPSQAILSAWVPPAATPIIADNLPPSLLTPAAAANPQLRGSLVPTEVLASWIALAFTPILQENLSPPVSGTVIALLFNELPQAILSAWQPVPFTPIVQENLSPPVSAPQNPPFVGGARVPVEVQLAWIPPVPLPITIDNIVPPIGQSPQNPPFNGGARVSGEVLISWIPPPPAPITIDNLVPPIAGPTPQNPPFMGGAEVPAAVLISWQPIAPAPITGAMLPPQPVVATVTPPARLSQEILSSWQNAPWPIISGEQLTPPSGPQPSPLVGSRIQQEILNSWRLADFAQIVSDNFAPTLPVVAASNPPFMGALVPLMVPDELAPIVARNLSPPISGPVASNPPFAGGSRVSTEILVGWLPPAPAPIVGPKYTIGALPPVTPPFVGGARVPLEVQIGWLPPAPMPIVGPKYTPGGPAPTNPPFAGSRLTVETQLNWIAPAPLPTLPVSVAPLLPVAAQQPPFAALPQAILASWVPDTRPIISAAKTTPPSGPVNPPLVGSRVSIEVLANWLPVAFAPITGPDLTPPSGPAFIPPIGARIPVEILASWQPASIYPIVADNLTPPSGPTFPPPLIGSNIPAATFAWHAAPPQIQLPQPVITPSGPVAFPFTGSAVPSAIFAWHGAAQQPQIPRPLPPIAQAFYPFVGTQVPREVLQSWEFVAQPIYRRAQVTISGPIASQPPIGGGSIIRLSVLVNWIPPPPMPALPRASVVVSLPPTSIVFPQASLKGFETPTNLSGVEPTPSLKGTKNDPSLKGD